LDGGSFAAAALEVDKRRRLCFLIHQVQILTLLQFPGVIISLWPQKLVWETSMMTETIQSQRTSSRLVSSRLDSRCAE
jgi:hypothetical protein